MEKGKKMEVAYLLPVKDKIMFLSGGRLYGLKGTHSLTFTRVDMEDQPLLGNKFQRINVWNTDTLVFSGDSLLFLFDLKKLNIAQAIQVADITAAVRFGRNNALATVANKDKLVKIDLSSKKIVQKYTALKDQHGQYMHNYPESIYHLQDQQYLITSPTAGVYIFDAQNETLIRHPHDATDDRSISANQASYIFSDTSGFFFVATAIAGLNYFKPSSPPAYTKPLFHNKITGRIYDAHINAIEEDAKGNLWLATQSDLIEWKRKTGDVFFHSYDRAKAKRKIGAIRTLYLDNQDNMWLGSANGIAVLDHKRQPVKYFYATSENGSSLPANIINEIIPSPDGTLWISTARGICFIDPVTFQVSFPDDNSPLNALQDKNCKTIWFRSDSDVWIATQDGAYNINLSNGDINTYTKENGLVFNEVTGFAGDNNHNIYIGTRFGFHLLEPGKPLAAYEEMAPGQLIDCYALLKDRTGGIWLVNSDYLAYYSPEEKKFKIYDEGSGISNAGFRFYAALETRDGELVFGTNKGITYFRPEQIHTHDIPFSVVIHEMETIDSSYYFSPNSSIKLPYYTNTVSFSYSVVNLLRNKNILYQYQLMGVDKNWVKTSTGQRITYDRLKPGKYLFKVKASSDGVRWVEARNPVLFYIHTPWWQRSWFVASCLLISIGIIILITWQRNRKIRYQQEQLETEQAINYLATSLHEQRTMEAILWDVAKNCIGRLKFVDCVIYLLDEKRNMLLQKAAWGPKTSDGNKIIDPIEIPLGKGIVGSVAKSGAAEIVSDTSKDNRYIADDARRLSEITVPITYNGQVLGIIDSEHPKKHFFTQKHLAILTTIAALCANKMVRIKAEEDQRRAQLELLEHERKSVEAQLKSLRLQMNPHFLFNSLNSIQQMILAGEDTAATRYLSKFSRLLRLVLLHSDREMVMLKEELETLHLYIELESLRFKETFDYDLICEEVIDPEEIKIPAMLIQPFIENAIWHGLLHKKGDRCLKIHFSEDSEENLLCVIEDNGIGREAARKGDKNNHTGKGIAAATERLKAHNEHHTLQSRVWIHDMKDAKGNAAGTRVTLVLPLL